MQSCSGEEGHHPVTFIRLLVWLECCQLKCLLDVWNRLNSQLGLSVRRNPSAYTSAETSAFLAGEDRHEKVITHCASYGVPSTRCLVASRSDSWCCQRRTVSLLWWQSCYRSICHRRRSSNAVSTDTMRRVVRRFQAGLRWWCGNLWLLRSVRCPTKAVHLIRCRPHGSRQSSTSSHLFLGYWAV